MVQIEGKYQLINSVNTEELLKMMGDEITQETIDELNSIDCFLTVDLDGDKYTFTNKTKYWERAIWFVVGKKFVEGDGQAITVVEKIGDTFLFNCWSYGKLLKRLYQFSDSGVVMTLENGTDKYVKRLYRRL